MDGSAHRVVVIGGGFGGLQAAIHLARAPVDLTLVDRRNFHLFQPLTYQLATGALSPGEVCYPLRAIFKRRANVRVLLAEVERFDLSERKVVVRPECGETGATPLAYDTLIVSGGSSYSYFGHDEWRTFAPEVKSLESALAARSRLLGAFEAAETETDPARRQAWLTFVVVGAGPTGVEMAGQIAELARDTLRRDYRAIDPGSGRVLLIEMADRVLTGFPPSLSQRAARSLERLGVTPLLERTVVGIDADGVTIQAPDQGVERVGTRTVIWAAGVTASGLAGLLAEQSGADLDRAGRVSVEPDLTLRDHPEVLALGDMVRVRGRRWCVTAAARSRTRGHAGGAVCGQGGSSPSGEPERRPLPLPRQGEPGDHRARQRGGGPARRPAERLSRLADLARGPPLVPDRLSESAPGADPVVDQLLHSWPGRAADHLPVN